MSNTQTAADWKQSAAALEQQRNQLFRQFDTVRAEQDSLRTSIIGYNRTISSSSSTPEQKAEAQQQKTSAQEKIRELDNQAAQIESQADQLRDQRNAALENAKTAESGPANSSPNTPPANAEPGPNTQPKPTEPAIPPTTQQSVQASSSELELPPGAEPDEGRQRGLAEPELIGLQTPEGAEPDEGSQPGLEEPPIIDQELTVPPGADEEEGQRFPGLAEPTGNETTVTARKSAARTTGNASLTPFPEAIDWRVRIHLPPAADYLYKDPRDPGILKPLQSTGGVLFPYTPSIQLSYNANYETTDVAHSNYKIYNYRNSSVESISITGDFTAQDTYEANYVLAVIHFFRSVTKMFYGKDENPVNGTPPPVVYLTGHGTYQFNYHPMVITNFTYNLPNDVDYINAGPGVGGTTGLSYYKPANVPQQQNILTRLNRLFASKLQPGGAPPPPRFTQLSQGQNIENTRVPTKIQIQLSALPIVTRNAISNNFSLKEYATGKLLRGNTRRGQGGGIW